MLTDFQVLSPKDLAVNLLSPYYKLTAKSVGERI